MEEKLQELLAQYKALRKERYLSRGMDERGASAACEYARLDLINEMASTKKIEYKIAWVEDEIDMLKEVI